MTFDDPQGDAYVFPVSEATVPVGEVDILQVELEALATEVRITMTLAALEQADNLATLPTADLFYIVAFQVVTPGGEHRSAVRVDHGLLRQSINDLLTEFLTYSFIFLPTGGFPETIPINGSVDVGSAQVTFLLPRSLLPGNATAFIELSATAQYSNDAAPSLTDFAPGPGLVLPLRPAPSWNETQTSDMVGFSDSAKASETSSPSGGRTVNAQTALIPVLFFMMAAARLRRRISPYI